MIYETHDLYKAAYLLCRGAKLERAEPDGKITRFIFENEGQLRDYALDLANNRPIGSADLINAMRAIRGLIAAGKRGQQ